MNYLIAKFIAPKFFGAPELTEVAEASLKDKMRDYFETLTWLLAETRYVARTFTSTIADIFAYNEIYTAMAFGLDLEPFPEVRAWLAEIGAIPEVEEGVSQAQEAFKKMIG